MACRCAPGAVKKSTKGRGMGFVCMRRVKNAPRIVKASSSGACPAGAKKKRMGKAGMRCMRYGPGVRFEAPVGCGPRKTKKKSKKRRR
jgi:hypothetical protein